MDHSVISHYRILHQLGEGGMGVVFAAEDLHLGREVAIKILRPDDADQAHWLARFEREARLASALQHPHICTIHELGEHEGRPFIVMELLEGRTIKQMLQDGPLPIPTAIEFAIQIAEALTAAHERGIVHRDIKPANLFVTRGDRLKVLDFGLAKIATQPMSAAAAERVRSKVLGTRGPEVTTTGATVGTAAYMSPEQATGAPIDARTDLFSFGSVLYEMATGKRAFPGESGAAVMQRLIAGEVIPARALNPTLPEGLDRIIRRALQNDKSKRYQTAAELLEDLRALSYGLMSSPARGDTALPAAGETTSARRWKIAAVAVIGVALLGAAWVWSTLPRTPALSDRDSILISRFANNTGETVFDETLVTALKVQLGQSPFLDIVPDARIAETLRLMGRAADEALDTSVAREVCQRLSLKALLEGSISRLGSNYVVTLNAMDCQGGASLASEQGEAASADEVLPLLGSLSRSMRTTLGESLPSIQRFDVPIEQATTPSLTALKAYAGGIAQRRRGREVESIAFFKQAIGQDPEFASAHTMLSTVYGSLGEWQLSEDYARQAYALQKRVSERERLFIEYQYHDRVTGDQDKAAQALEVWKLSYPRDARPVNALALIHNRFGRYEQAAADAQEALERSPGNPFPMSNLAAALRGQGKYNEARKVAEEAVRLGVATTPTRRLLYQLGVLAGDGSEKEQLEWAKDSPREFDLLSGQAQVAAFQGRLGEAADLYSRAADKARVRGLRGTASSYAAHLAWTEALYGDSLETSVRVREIVSRMAADSEGLASVPRFRAPAALGLAGAVDAAQEIMARAEQRYPDSTVVRYVLSPVVTAAIALSRGRSGEALAALERAVPAERGTVAGLIPMYLRGQAFLVQGDGAAARREYQKLLDARGADPFAPVVPLAHLGLARAWAADGDALRSREAYEELFRIWAQADSSLLLLQRARAEHARLLRAGPSTTPSSSPASH
ncbi:MAG TPA: protein kinase [Vicinamibacterales bacterium]|nr:protein kinase [Vicinamibacterales bacterium]